MLGLGDYASSELPRSLCSETHKETRQAATSKGPKPGIN